METIIYLFALSFTYRGQSGIALISAPSANDAFSVLKNQGNYNASPDGYVLSKSVNLGVYTYKDANVILIESYVNAEIAYTAIYNYFVRAGLLDGFFPSDVAPLMDENASAGSATTYSRSDHVHPSDISKQDAIADLGDIRSGASKGATAYQKPDGGIPKNHLASSVQSSLNLADSAYQLPASGIPEDALSSSVKTKLNDKEVFIAEYGVTAFDDIYAAYSAGKVVCCQIYKKDYIEGWPDSTSDYTLLPAENVLNDMHVAYFFRTYFSETNKIKQVQITLAGGWSRRIITETIPDVMTGAGSSTAGSSGLVPAPAAGDNEKFLRGDGTWQTAAGIPVTSWSNPVLDTNIPSEKLVKDSIDDVKVFWAIYNSTTAPDIIDAVDAGKLVMIKYNDTYFYLDRILKNTNNEVAKITFDAQWATTNFDIQLSKEGGVWVWSSHTRSLETSGNKVSSWQATPDNTHYPSEKLVYDSLGQKGVISQTQTWAEDYGSYAIAEESKVYGIIPQSFIDRWKSLVYSWGTFNETSGYFELNGLTDISYNEALDIVNRYNPAQPSEGWRPNSTFTTDYFKARTSIPCISVVGTYPFLTWNTWLECAHFSYLDSSKFTSFIQYGCYRLRKILDKLNLKENLTLTNWYALEECYIATSKNITASQSKYLSLASIVYMVNNATNTGAVTYIFHADAYARCQADTTEYTYSGQTYTGISALANAKLITIASA